MRDIDHSSRLSNRVLIGMLLASALLALALVGIAALVDFESREEENGGGAAAARVDAVAGPPLAAGLSLAVTAGDGEPSARAAHGQGRAG